MATPTPRASVLPLLLLCAGSLAARAAPAERIGLGPLRLPAGEHPHGGKLAAWLREGAALLPGVSAVEVLAPASCAPDEGRCLAASAKGLGLDKTITADVTAQGRGYRWLLRSFGPDGAPAAEARGEVEGGPLDLFGSLEGGVCKLLGREPCGGELRITSEADAGGAHVFVDGHDEGALPIARPILVPIGRHAVRVASSEERVRVSYGRAARLAVAMRGGAPELGESSGVLAAAPPPPAIAPSVLRGLAAPSPRIRSQTATALIAAGLGLAAAGTGFGLWAHLEGQRLDARYRDGTLTDADRPRYGQVRAAGLAATALLGSGAGALACGGLLFALTPQGAAVAGRF